MTQTNAVESLYEFVKIVARRNNLDPEKAETILRLLLTRQDGRGLSDEDLAGKTGYKQGEIRNILRLFYTLRLANYRRGRHPETGATRYYWYVDLSSVNMALYWRKVQVLEKLKMRLEYEKSNTFYRCPNDGTRFTLEEAFENDFQCPKCSALLEEEDNSEIIRILEEEIARLEEEIARDAKLVRGR